MITYTVRRVQRDPLYVTVEVRIDSTTVELGCLNKPELEKLVGELQDLIADITRLEVA